MAHVTGKASSLLCCHYAALTGARAVAMGAGLAGGRAERGVCADGWCDGGGGRREEEESGGG